MKKTIDALRQALADIAYNIEQSILQGDFEVLSDGITYSIVANGLEVDIWMGNAPKHTRISCIPSLNFSSDPSGMPFSQPHEVYKAVLAKAKQDNSEEHC